MSGTGPSRSPKLHHIPALDGIRGVAVLLVLASHFLIGDPNRGMRALAFKVAQAGWIGVDLFFVLSGFLITSILRDALGEPDYFKNFYVRRVLRIFPLYFGTLIILFLVVPHFPGMAPPTVRTTLSHQWAAWSYTINFVPLRWNGEWLFIGHFWSLAIEEQFYLLWPLILFYAGPRKARWFAVGGIALSIACRASLQAASAANVMSPRIMSWACFYWTFCHLDGLAIGCLIALTPLRKGSRRAVTLIGVVATTVVALLVWTGGIQEIHDIPFSVSGHLLKTFGFTLLAIFGGFLITTATGDGPSSVAAFFSLRSLRLAGRYSYGIYVIHGVLRPWLVKTFPATVFLPRLPSYDLAAYAAFIVQSTITIALAVLSYELYEKPFLRMKARFGPKDSHTAESSAAAS